MENGKKMEKMENGKKIEKMEKKWKNLRRNENFKKRNL